MQLYINSIDAIYGRLVIWKA